MISLSDTVRGQRQWGTNKMGLGIKGSSTQPCEEHWKLMRYCLVSSCQVIVICKMIFPPFSFTAGILEMASFLRYDKVNPILSSIWKKNTQHFKLVLHLSNKPMHSAYTEYHWMKDPTWDMKVPSSCGTFWQVRNRTEHVLFSCWDTGDTHA